MVRNKLVVLAAVFALILATSLVASATTVTSLTLINGANSVTVTDGGVGDLNALPGVITFVGSVGSFTLNVDTGTSTPTLPLGEMDLNYNAMGTGTLQILFSTSGYTGSGGGTSLAIGGTLGADSTLTYNAYFDDSNALFGMANLIGSIGPFTNTGDQAIAMSGSAYGDIVSNSGLYSVTQELVITARGAQSTGDAHLQIPEPASMSVLGAGLIGLAGLLRRKLVK